MKFKCPLTENDTNFKHIMKVMKWGPNISFNHEAHIELHFVGFM